MAQTNGSEEKKHAPGPIEAVLFTVGGTIDPICHTLETVRPRCVAFVCSEATKGQVSEIEAWLRPLGLQAVVKTFIADDPDDLTGCTRKCREALSWLLRDQKIPSQAVRVDYTGGKKNMSAAAVLAAVPEGLQFLYVAGEAGKGGVGTVLPGRERLKENVNPWDELGDEPLRLALNIADEGQYAAAVRIVEKQKARAGDLTAKRLTLLSKLLQGLIAWDAFDHRRALNCWNQGRVLHDLAAAGEHSGDTLLRDAARTVLSLVPYVQRAAEATEAGWFEKKEEHDPLLPDLTANAEAKAACGQTDLAVLLHYRTLELNAARRLRRFHQMDNGKVVWVNLPPALQTAWKNRYDAAGGVIKLGLNDSYFLLAELGDDHGLRYRHEMETWRQWAAARNLSWLVHGAGRLSEDAFQKSRLRVLNFLKIDEKKLPRRPKFMGSAPAVR
jgi:CRISPR-associated protein (TIGR02710 family)